MDAYYPGGKLNRERYTAWLLAAALVGAALAVLATAWLPAIPLAVVLVVYQLALFWLLRRRVLPRPLQVELARRTKDYELLFNAVPCYITVHDRDYKIVEANDLFRRDFGDCTGRHCYRIYKGRDSICHDCPVRKSFADGQVHSSEETVLTKDGRWAKVIVYSMPIVDDGGKITSVMEVSTNITRVKELQHQLAMVGLAVSGMAHRIKNILMGLEGGIFVTRTGFETDDQSMVDEGWEMVQRNVSRVSQVTKDLLFCSKERQPQLEAGVSPVAIAREVFQLYTSRTELEEVALEADLPEEERRGAFDPEALRSLIENLIANAIDACRFDPAHDTKKSRIILHLAFENDDCLIEVEDNGQGIPDELSGRIFDGFFSTKGTEGTGLGLFVVQKVVKEHDGEVDVRSVEGEGTTFSVRLPLRGS